MEDVVFKPSFQAQFISQKRLQRVGTSCSQTQQQEAAWHIQGGVSVCVFGTQEPGEEARKG